MKRHHALFLMSVIFFWVSMVSLYVGYGDARQEPLRATSEKLARFDVAANSPEVERQFNFNWALIATGSMVASVVTGSSGYVAMRKEQIDQMLLENKDQNQGKVFSPTRSRGSQIGEVISPSLQRRTSATVEHHRRGLL